MIRRCGVRIGLATGAAALCLSVMLTVNPQPAQAGKGGAFVGGLIGGHILTNMSNRDERRTRAAEQRAYQQPPPQQAAPAQPAQPAQKTPQQKLDQLDQLAAGGYITKEEYQRRRQAIIDGL